MNLGSLVPILEIRKQLTIDIVIKRISPLIESTSGCDGKLGPQQSCCTSQNRCAIGEGDCDYDFDCAGDLICGKDNCLPIFGHGSKNYDCCKEGKTLWIQKDKLHLIWFLMPYILQFFDNVWNTLQNN